MASRARPAVHFVAIVGPSGAGKTWLADHLARTLGRRAARLSLDDFYADRSELTLAQRRRINFDHPRSIDWALFEQSLRALRAGRTVRVPHYDYTTSCRTRRVKPCRPRPVVIVEGLWLLRRPSLRRWWDLTIYVDCPARLRLERRLHRDRHERARDQAEIRRQFRERVQPSTHRFVEPQRNRADRVVESPMAAGVLGRLAREIRVEGGGSPKSRLQRAPGG